MYSEESSKVIRIFKLINALQFGKSIQDLCMQWNCSERTIYRYFGVIRELGLEVTLENQKYRIIKNDHSEIRFSEDELNIIASLLASVPSNDARKKVLMDKVNLMKGVGNDYINLSLSLNIDRCAEAISEKKRIRLSPYYSAKSDSSSERVVEPKSISNDYVFLNAVDVADKKLKVFKINRIGRVELLPEKQRIDSLAKEPSDMFGMTGKEEIKVKFSMNLRSKMLLEEEFPASRPFIKKKKGTYVFEGPVRDFKGVGRFVLGLWDEVEVSKPKEFVSFLRSKIE